MRLSVAAMSAFAVSLLSSMASERLSSDIPIVGTFVRLSLSRNGGIAFGIAIPSPWEGVLIAAALCAVTWMALRPPRSPWSDLSFGLILGGAAANLLDRWMDGFVTDIIAVGTFPVFNVADACITIGAGMLLLHAAKGGPEHAPGQ